MMILVMMAPVVAEVKTRMRRKRMYSSS